jgi:5-methylcytosine-specific restriction enzyme A
MTARPCRHPGCPNLVTERRHVYCPRHEATVKRPCAEPGCPELVGPLDWKCPRHLAEHEQAYDAHRGSARSRGYNVAWDRLRKMYLAEHPLCEDHKARGKVVEAVMVHHVVPISEGGEPLDPSNLRALCNWCHSARHKGRMLKQDEDIGNDAFCN